MSKADCRKFVPNIFNKSKCATCFKAKDEHSEEALENNRASRKVAKCGYLFVAPDWDFSNPINRTKRWQRRWFVLYDDGELTYSVDEHPETVPQAIIDMNRVVEVSEAEEVTGHPFSLALTAADRVHFLKGTSREESKWWFDVLSMFPRTNMKTGRHKRNATFPGSKATTIPSQQTTAPNSPCLGKGVTIQPFQTPPMARPRFHSCHTEPASPASSSSTLGFQNFNLLPVKDTNGKKMSTTAANDNNNKTVTAALEETDVIPVKESPSPSTAKENNPAAEKDLNILDKDLEEKFKTRRVIRREIRGARSARCNSEILSSMLIQSQQQQQQGSNNKAYAIVLPTPSSTSPSSGLNKNTSALPERPRSALLLPPSGSPRANGVSAAANASSSAAHSPFYLYMADVPRNRHYESLESLQHDRLATPHITTGSKLTDIRGRVSSKDTPDSKIESSPAHAGYLGVGTVRERPVSLQDLGSRLAHYNDNNARPVETSCIPAPEATTRPPSGMKSPGEAVRGDPDGCGLDPIPSFCSPLPDRRSTLSLSSSSSVADDANVKKGWLLKMSYSGDWNKCWFVLKGHTLSCYSDHAAEDANRADETIDLGEVFSVDELDIGRSYGFQLLGFDGKKYSLAALTSGIRTLWVQALRNASNQSQVGKSQMQQPQSKATLKAEKENVNPEATAAAPSTTTVATATMVTAGDDDEDDTESMESFDDEQHTTTSSDETDSHAEMDSPNAMASLPPSPPLNRTPISKVKERDRSRSSSRSRSRHRSQSPPTSPSRDHSPPPLLLQQQPQSYLAAGSDPRESSQLQLRLEAAKGEITKLLTERRDQEKEAKQQLTLLTQRLSEKEQHVRGLITTLETARNESQRQLVEMRTQLDAKESDLKAAREEASALRSETADLRESLKCERSEVYKLRDVAQELRSLLDSRNDTLDQLQVKSDEVDELKKQLTTAQQNLTETQERLQRGIDENESLFARLRQMEGQSRTQNDRYFGSSLRRSRSSTGSMPLPLQLCSHLSQSQSSKKSLPRLDSLSDLSNIDYDLDLESIEKEHLVDEYIELRARFEKAVQEIRALKRELKQTQSSLDSVEVAHMAMKQQWQAKENDYASQLELMAARIQDLTSKMGVADKQVRQLKVKIAKSENREKRRTQSLKGRESFQLSKEVEEKLVELEGKMVNLLGAQPGTSEKAVESSPVRHRKGFEETTKSFRMRRKSLDGGGNDSVKILLRVEQLEQQLSHTSSGGSSCSSSVKSHGKKPMERKGSFHGKSPQGKPPRANSLVKSSTSSSSSTTSTLKRTDSQTSTDTDVSGSVKSTKTLRLAQDLEQCLMELELIFSSQEPVDGQSLISKIRQIQQELLNPDRSRSSVSGSATVSEGQSQLDKIQELLRVRLSELKVKRDHVRNMGKLDSAAVSQIAAEKLALELTIAEQLFGLVKQPEQKESVRDAHWTIQKLNWLKRKLVGEKSVPALEQSTSFGTYCAALAERMSAVAAISSSVQRAINNGNGGSNSDSTDCAGSSTALSCALPTAVAHHLADEERDLSQLFARYKEEKLQELARLLAYETIRMGDNQAGANDNQLVEEVKVREAWLQAQDVANKELVDSEVRQAMMRMAEVFAEDVAAEERLAASLLFWPVQQMQYEQRCQVVEEVLRQEMEEAVLMLSNAYEKCLHQMRSGELQPPTDGDLETLLSEFAEIVAHKALVDGHIAVLQGESPASLTVSTSDLNLSQNVAVVQQTENIIAPLSSKGIGSSDFFPTAMNYIEVAAIIHRNLVERRGLTSGGTKGEQSNDSGPINPQMVVNEELIRQKYQGEIEQLRALTEKGMSAMEATHKRIIAELEEKHRQELARLQVEKERALAEETQATLAALDAMRKAHEAEVQREIGRFKEEFLRQMATRQESTQQHEKEMQEIRREILSLSERYSHKCLESAALEQKVSSISQQLAVAQRQISDLDARNQQLRAFIETDVVQCDQPDVSQAQVIKAKESQLLMMQEDMAELQFCLRESQTREEELATLARQLGQYLRTERPLRPDEVSALRHRLEEQLLLSGPSSSSSAAGRHHSSSGFASSIETERSGKGESPPREVSRFHYVRSKDLTRSPSCPRLSGFLSLAPRLTTRSVLQREQTLSGPSTNSSSN